MMSKTLILSTLIVFSMSVAYASQDKSGCEIKRKTLKKQLEYAQTDKNERLITGLTRTLKNIKATCALEKRVQDKNNKPKIVKNNLADNSPSLKQADGKKRPRKPAKSNTMDTGKKVQAKQK
ncbi:DUF1090 family protein [Xenorhabdus lircayensis]|uniref:DUF1090 family protein n=1 Tax=Xenorhabdus lircayensis TaxID=2763499 RepID=A0ABS0U8J7_9GAMM|nr:DUF1090 family protein [Xenorhabdus lircayensis]MBI6550201.1 DUF1090 family protein [Xenorhabdus lircayensis]